MATHMQRRGDCNRCGQCCGAEESPYQDNPWPIKWYDANSRCWIQDWLLEHLLSIWPQAALLGVTSKADGRIQLPNPLHGSTQIADEIYYWVWVPGHAVCKDISLEHDGSSYSLECPFLKPDLGDGARPCALINTNHDNAFRVACEPHPLLEETVERVADWQMRHPLCSYIWE